MDSLRESRCAKFRCLRIDWHRLENKEKVDFPRTGNRDQVQEDLPRYRLS